MVSPAHSSCRCGSALALAVGPACQARGGAPGTSPWAPGSCSPPSTGWDFLAGHGSRPAVPGSTGCAPRGPGRPALDPLGSHGAVVTGWGRSSNLYSIGYMKGDPRFGRFFAYMNLFVASMLILVLADGFALLFVGWELVGLCSYLLISFWFEKPAAAAAGRRPSWSTGWATPGSWWLSCWCSPLRLAELPGGCWAGPRPELYRHGHRHHPAALMGAAGKSAQFPCTCGCPTPWRAHPRVGLIHAATMVTAGVFLVARTGALFALAPASRRGGVRGHRDASTRPPSPWPQHDIKRVLAYSTISQLGLHVRRGGGRGPT